VNGAFSAELPASDPELRSARLGGLPLIYTDVGPRDAPALLAVHGIPGSVRDFRYLGAQVEAQLRFVRIDLPGFGGSPPVRDAVRTLAGRVRVVLALADQLGLERFAVLGHSMGGGTALLTAAHAPERVTLVALLASVALSLHRGLGLQPRVFALLGRALDVPILRALLLPLVRAQYRRRRLPGADQLGAAELALQLQAIAAVDFGLLRQAVAGRLPPALHCYSRDDHMIETHISEELSRALPGARVLAFDQGGHNIQKTHAPEIGQALRECLLGSG